jgi:drug/metabolite transporter (DMT)-like permease
MTAMTATRSATARLVPSSAALAFVGVVVLGGVNAVAVRVAVGELGPLWTAALRFGIAALVLLAATGLTRTPMPRGRALAGSALYGAVGFAGAFGCIHWALVGVPPADAQTILALVPLLTFLFAVGVGLERFRAASLAGGLVAFAGIAVIFGERLRADTPLAPLLAVVVGAGCMAAGNVIVKRVPGCHPLANNAVAMSVGAAVLVVASLLAGERPGLPADPRTWAAISYVSLAGSAGVFTLFVHVVRRWTASSASYVMLLMPLVTVVVAAAVTGEPITAPFVAGSGLVLAGVYLGTLRRRRPPTPAVAAIAGPRRSVAAQPGCA